MTAITVEEVQNDLAQCLRRIKQGETLLITQADRPVAELKPVSPTTSMRRPVSLCKGEFTVPDDFNEPLPEDILRLFEGR